MIRNGLSVINKHLILSSATKCYGTNVIPKWDIYAGVALERLPVITKTLEPIEKQYLDHLNNIEFSNSLKSDHELRHEKDLINLELLKQGELDSDFDLDATKQTAQDMEDAFTEEYNKFKLASRITEADNKTDKKSIKRKLEENLFLLVEQDIGKNKLMLLPQGKYQNGETMRQTAERILSSVCGNNIQALFYGNAPCGFYKYKYPASERNETVGAKIFFFRAVLQKGNIVNDKYKFEWLNKKEMTEKVSKSYNDSISQFMI